jgi:hypothetical protein
MTLSDISDVRLQNQQIESSKFLSAKELVGWMGAMQSQDFAMSKWAIGLRTLNSTEKSIEAAFNQGDIIRTHLLRPTWHVVSSDDIYWIQQLTAQYIRPTLKSRNKQLELSEEVFSKSNKLLEKFLSNGLSLTREDLIREYDNIHIKTNENRLSHLLMNAELDGIICSGSLQGNKLTYCLLEERVPNKKMLSRDESLSELANRYFSSHSPATLRDFIWWSGLPVTVARKALEMIKSGLNSETINFETYWFTDQFDQTNLNYSVHLLPAFDEFLIAYRDRSASITITNNKIAISDNGIFRPIIVANGHVIGLWKRAIKKDQLMIETTLFCRQDEKIKNEIEKQAKQYADFLHKKLKLQFDI